MLDIKKVAEESATDSEVYELVVLDRKHNAYPDPKPALSIVGEYSEAYRKNERAYTDMLQASHRKGEPWDEERFAASKIAAGVVGWKNIVIDGQEAKYSPAGVIELFLAAPWIAKQAERAIRRHADFFGSDATGS